MYLTYALDDLKRQNESDRNSGQQLRGTEGVVWHRHSVADWLLSEQPFSESLSPRFSTLLGNGRHG